MQAAASRVDIGLNSWRGFCRWRLCVVDVRSVEWIFQDEALTMFWRWTGHVAPACSGNAVMACTPTRGGCGCQSYQSQFIVKG